MHPPELLRDVKVTLPIFSLSSYDECIAKAIKIAKYKPSAKLLSELIELACINPPSENGFIRPDILVPVPLHPSKQALRGFNQSEKIARRIATKWNSHFSPCIARTRAAKSQAECNESERASNLKDAFALANNLDRCAFRDKRICIMDDVATTGFTLAECAGIIRDLKPKSIQGCVLTHAPRYLPR